MVLFQKRYLIWYNEINTDYAFWYSISLDVPYLYKNNKSKIIELISSIQTLIQNPVKHLK